MSKKVLEELKQLQSEARNPDTMNLDSMSVREILEAMNREDRKVIDVVAQALSEIEKAVDLVVGAFQSGGRLIYVGAGTSGRLGVLDAAECPPTFGVEPEMVRGIIAGGYGALVKSAEGAEDDRESAMHDLDAMRLSKADVVCGIAASRRTPYVLAALSHAHKVGCKTLFIICNKPESGERKAGTPPNPPVNGGEPDVVISLTVGPEVLTGSTRLKAGTATKLVLNMLTTAAMVRLGKCYENLMVDLRCSSEKLRARARGILMEICALDYDAADALLLRANSELKTAMVMQKKTVDAETARELLTKNGGNVRKAIEETMNDECRGDPP